MTEPFSSIVRKGQMNGNPVGSMMFSAVDTKRCKHDAFDLGTDIGCGYHSTLFYYG